MRFSNALRCVGVSFFCTSVGAILQNRKSLAKCERIRKAKHFKSPEDWDEQYKLNPPKKHCHIRKAEVDEDAIVPALRFGQKMAP